MCDSPPLGRRIGPPLHSHVQISSAAHGQPAAMSALTVSSRPSIQFVWGRIHSATFTDSHCTERHTGLAEQRTTVLINAGVWQMAYIAASKLIDCIILGTSSDHLHRQTFLLFMLSLL